MQTREIIESPASRITVQGGRYPEKLEQLIGPLNARQDERLKDDAMSQHINDKVVVITEASSVGGAK